MKEVQHKILWHKKLWTVDMMPIIDANVGENISTSFFSYKEKERKFVFYKEINYFSSYINDKLNIIVN